MGRYTGPVCRQCRREGVTGELLLQLLEMRLDNIVYRLGLAPSRRAARQFVLHGHILVNDRKAAVPSHVLKVGDVLTVKDATGSREAANRSVEAATGAQLPVWMSFDKATLRAEVLAVPTREPPSAHPILSRHYPVFAVALCLFGCIATLCRAAMLFAVAFSVIFFVYIFVASMSGRRQVHVRRRNVRSRGRGLCSCVGSQRLRVQGRRHERRGG